MNAPEYLNADELQAVTGFARAAEQEGWLKERALPHQRVGNRVIVSRFHLQQAEERAERQAGLAERIASFILRPDADLIPAGEYPPQSEFNGIYMLFAKEGALNYVGKSVGVGYRSVQHVWAMRRGTRRPFSHYAAIEVPWEYMDGMEVAHIHALEPPENTLPRVSWDHHADAVKLIQDIWGPKQ